MNEVQGEYAEGAKTYLIKMVEEFMIENTKIEPFASRVFDENWKTFTLRYVVDYKSRRRTKDKISQKVLKVTKESKGKISIASSPFEITAFHIEVKLKKANREQWLKCQYGLNAHTAFSRTVMIKQDDISLHSKFLGWPIE